MRTGGAAHETSWKVHIDGAEHETLSKVRTDAMLSKARSDGKVPSKQMDLQGLQEQGVLATSPSNDGHAHANDICAPTNHEAHFGSGVSLRHGIARVVRKKVGNRTQEPKRTSDTYASTDDVSG